jgi:hypothetical protein
MESGTNVKAKSKGSQLNSNNMESSPTANFDCSEEYFVDDEDDQLLPPNLANDSVTRVKRASSLEPSDYHTVYLQTPPEERICLNNSESTNPFNKYPNNEKCNGEGYGVGSSEKTSQHNDFPSSSQQPEPTYRPTVQRYSN